MSPKLFPSILSVLQVAAALVYFQSGDPRRTIYWLAGSVITAAVTF